MPYDLTRLSRYLKDASPSEISRLLRSVRYDVVVSAVERQDYDTLCDKYLGLMLLEDQFLQLNESLND